MKAIKIHKEVGECISIEEFCVEMGKLVKQTPEMVRFAIDTILEEIPSNVEAMEIYCNICEIKAY